MAQPATKRARTKPEPRERPRWLCSHLVHLDFVEAAIPSQTALLEEIDAEGAALALDHPCPIGLTLQITAEGFDIPAQVTQTAPRETDFLLEVCFMNGRRWEPNLWKPDHLFLPPLGKQASPNG